MGLSIDMFGILDRVFVLYPRISICFCDTRRLISGQGSESIWQLCSTFSSCACAIFPSPVWSTKIFSRSTGLGMNLYSSMNNEFVQSWIGWVHWLVQVYYPYYKTKLNFYCQGSLINSPPLELSMFIWTKRIIQKGSRCGFRHRMRMGTNMQNLTI